MDCQLIIFTKPYNSSEAKTRLRKGGLSDLFVNELHNKLLEHTLRAAENFKASNTKVSWYSQPDNSKDYLPSNFEYNIQNGNDFSSRLQNCWDDSTQNNSDSTILIGSDCPGINLEILNQVKSTLASGKACIGPTPDNGFYLIALPSNSLEIDFKAIISSKNQVEAACKSVPSEMQILPILRDIDQPKDIIESLFLAEHLNPLAFLQ